MIYCRKSFYKKLDSFKTGKIAFFLLQMFALIIMLYNYKVGFIVLNVFSLLYFSLHMFFIERNISKYNTEITRHHKGRVKVYRALFYIYVIFTIALVFNVILSSALFSVLWWVGAVAIMLYSECVSISSVVAFGKDGYLSGDYYVKYEDIEEIREEKNINSWRGEIVWIILLKNNKKIGFDKMFLDEYHDLRLKIYQC